MNPEDDYYDDEMSYGEAVRRRVARFKAKAAALRAEADALDARVAELLKTI